MDGKCDITVMQMNLLAIGLSQDGFIVPIPKQAAIDYLDDKNINEQQINTIIDEEWLLDSVLKYENNTYTKSTLSEYIEETRTNIINPLRDDAEHAFKINKYPKLKKLKDVGEQVLKDYKNTVQYAKFSKKWCIDLHKSVLKGIMNIEARINNLLKIIKGNGEQPLPDILTFQENDMLYHLLNNAEFMQLYTCDITGTTDQKPITPKQICNVENVQKLIDNGDVLAHIEKENSAAKNNNIFDYVEMNGCKRSTELVIDKETKKPEIDKETGKPTGELKNSYLNDGSTVFWRRGQFKVLKKFSKHLIENKPSDGGIIAVALQIINTKKIIVAASTHLKSGGEHAHRLNQINDGIVKIKTEINDYITNHLPADCQTYEIIGMDGNEDATRKGIYDKLYHPITSPHIQDLIEKEFALNNFIKTGLNLSYDKDGKQYKNIPFQQGIKIFNNCNESNPCYYSVNKQRGIESMQLFKIFEEEHQLIDYIFYSPNLILYHDTEKMLKLPKGHGFDIKNVLPSINNPSDHLPVIICLKFNDNYNITGGGSVEKCSIL